MRAAVWIGALFALHLAALAAVYALLPWHLAFDDAFHIQDGLLFARSFSLRDDGLFLRVPLWPIVLGTSFSIFGMRAGLFVLQATIVLTSIVCFWRYRGREARMPFERPEALLVGAFVLSPQLLLYSRHAVNELWIGLLAMGVMLLCKRLDATRCLLLGAVVAAAGMTKIVAFALAAPVAVCLLRAEAPRLRKVAWCLGGAALVFLPLLGLHWAERGIWLLDNTGAYQLSTLSLAEWRGIDGAAARQAAGMASFWEAITSQPLAYAQGFAERAVTWLLRPSSADFASFFPSYPRLPIRIADEALFLGFGALAALGTTRREAPIWLFVAAVWLASTFPSHTPYTPRLIVLFPWLLLAPAGLQRLLAAWRGSLSAETARAEPRK